MLITHQMTLAVVEKRALSIVHVVFCVSCFGFKIAPHMIVAINHTSHCRDCDSASLIADSTSA